MAKKEALGGWGIAWRVALVVLLAAVALGVVFVAAVHLSPVLPFLAAVPQAEGQTSSLLGAASVALGTATLALTFVGFLVALLAIFGWRSIQERVDFEVARAMKEERKYDKAQGRLSQGITFGLINQYLTRIVPELGEEASRTFFLEDAISYLENAARDLRGDELEGPALNALAYTLALRGRAGDGTTAWNLAKDCEVLARQGKRHESYPLTRGTVAARFAAELPDLTTAELRALRREVEQTPIMESIRFRQHEKSIVLRELDAVLEGRPNDEPPPKRGRFRSAWEALMGR